VPACGGFFNGVSPLVDDTPEPCLSDKRHPIIEVFLSTLIGGDIRLVRVMSSPKGAWRIQQKTQISDRGDFMQTLPRGFVAGLIATGVLSAVLLIQASLGALPQVNMIAMLATLVSASMLVGWIAHFVIGALLWGLLYALIYPRIPGRGPVAKALAFAVGAWLAMMILLLPATGAGLFGLAIGLSAPIATLVLHLLWGAVLGAAFARL